MSLDVPTFIRLINKAMEEQRDERLYRQWLVQLPHMDKDHFVSFEDYRDRCTGANIDTRSESEILAEIDEIEKQFEERRNARGDFQTDG